MLRREPADYMRTCVIFNPAARGQKAERLKSLLQGMVGEIECRPTTCAGEARTLASAAIKDGFVTIVAAGGDGTVNEVLNGIGDAPDGFARARLGVLPLGTVNVLARELKLPLDLPSAWQVVLRGKETAIDLPCAEFQSAGKTESRYFAQLAGAGLDAHAVSLVNWKLKKKIGPLAYVVAGLNAMGSEQPKITLKTAKGATSGEMALIGNGQFYGGTFKLFPDASLVDGELDYSIFPRMRWFTLLQATFGLAFGKLHGACGVAQIRATEAVLTSDRQTFLQLDGELVGELPARISVERARLRIVH
jgi:diacylglycerol kinase (ATP)